jgi:hypothetical protein
VIERITGFAGAQLIPRDTRRRPGVNPETVLLAQPASSADRHVVETYQKRRPKKRMLSHRRPWEAILAVGDRSFADGRVPIRVAASAIPMLIEA